MPRKDYLMANFIDVLGKGDLYDIGQKGEKFTWSNRHCDETFTKERLDKAMANIHWSNFYRERSLEVLIVRSSNHRPILFSLSKFKKVNLYGKKGFKYEA